MADLLRTILIMSATGSVLALLLFAFKPLARHRLPKSTQYYLWLVVIAALLVPVSRLVVLPGGQAAAMPIPTVPTISETITRFVITQAEETEMLTRIAPLAETNPPVYLQERQAVQSPLAFVTTYVVLVYPLGVLILLMYFAVNYVFFVKIYRRRNRTVDPATRAMLDRLCGGRLPRIYNNDLAETPMLFGILRPAIILPVREYTDYEMQAILVHELTHLRRKDVLVKWLALVAMALHWFNPLVWLVRREIDCACELSCDEAVIQGLDGQGRRHYGNTLINVAAHPKTPRAITSATMSEDKKNLKVRLGAIMKSKRHARYVILISALLVVATVGLAACLGSGRGNNPVVIESETPAGYPLGYYNEPDYPGYTDDVPITELILQMAPAVDAPLGDFDSYYEIDFRDHFIAYWGAGSVDWLTINMPAAIWANMPLRGFQLIGLYLDHSDDGVIATATHVYYEIEVLDSPLVINWFFTAGLFPNNGIAFLDADGIWRTFAIQAGYGYEGSEPFTLIEFSESSYIFRWDAQEDPANDYPGENTAGTSHGVLGMINGSFELVISSIALGEVILLGVLDLEPGDRYRLLINAENRRGLFFGVTNSSQVTSASGDGHAWVPFQGAGSNVMNTYRGGGYRYVYVGSSVGLGGVDEIPDVRVSFTVYDDGVPRAALATPPPPHN